MAAPRAAAAWMGDEARAPFRRYIAWAFVAVVIASLAYQLHEIGLAKVWETRPRSPLFYLFVLGGYLTLPLADVAIYRRLWGVDFLSTLAVSLRKRIYNSAFVGYSGEVMLLLWARGRVERSPAELAHDIKDSNILSALVSTYVTAGLLIYLLASGAFSHITSAAFEAWAIVTLGFAALAPVAFLFRRHFMFLAGGTALVVLAIHASRFFIAQSFILGQWRVEMPEIGLGTLASLLGVQMLVARIPMLPNRDLLFVSIGIAVSGALNLPQAQIASLLITTNAMQQLLHLLVIVVSTVGSPLGLRTVAR